MIIMVTRKCKQCGKEFTLSDSEIEFYNKKGLNIPKRCKECRDANKPAKTDNTYKYSNYKSETTTNNILVKRVVAVVALVAIVAVFAPQLLQLIDWNTDSNSDISSQNKNTYSTSDSSNTSVSEKGESFDVVSSSVIESVLSSESSSKENQEPIYESSSTLKVYTFRNDELLNDHYKKHGVYMSYASAKEYEKAASNVVNSMNALHKTEKEDGDEVYYMESTNEFVIISTDGYIRTFFNPDDGKAYFDRQ